MAFHAMTSALLIIVPTAVAVRQSMKGVLENSHEVDSAEKSMTFFSFGLADRPPSFAEVSARAGLRRPLTVAERAAAWENELAVYQAQPAVKSFWQHTTTYTDYGLPEACDNQPPQTSGDCEPLPMKVKIEEIKAKVIPGLKDEQTFGHVLETLNDNGCALWIIGGTVRDLLGGGSPKDVDCCALCSTDRIQEIASDHGWQNNKIKNRGYFTIGKPHHDDGLEGMEIGQSFSNAYASEWSVNILAYSVTADKVIDPSGKGVEDAQHQPGLLRIGAPALEAFPSNKWPMGDQWKLWNKWMDSQPMGAHARHVRYLKMRVRGWEPQDECTRFFMANQYVFQGHLEGTEKPLNTPPSRQKWKSDKKSQNVMVWPAGTLFYINQMTGKALGRTATAEAQEEFAVKFLQVMQADLDQYFGAVKGTCTDTGIIAKDATGETSSKEFFGNFYTKQCEGKNRKPPFKNQCNAIKKFSDGL